MKRILFFSLALTAGAMMNWSCSKEALNDAPSAPAALKSTLSPTAFNYWTTCGSNAYYSGSTIYVPVTSSCSSQVNAAQEKTGQTVSNLSFYGNFVGGNGATSYAEMAVFVCDNVSQWNGDEMGYVYTLQDAYLKAYVQGGGQYYTSVISSGNAGWHTYNASASGTNKVDFYVDGSYKTSLTNYSGTYTSRYYYAVATNHWAGGSGNYSIQVNNINVW